LGLPVWTSLGALIGPLLGIAASGLQASQEILDVLSADSLSRKSLLKLREHLRQAAVEGLLLHPADPGDFGDLELRPHADEDLVLLGECLHGPEEGRIHPPFDGLLFLFLELLFWPEVRGRLGFELVVRDEPPETPGGELGAEVRKLENGQGYPFSPKDLAGLVEAELIPDQEPFQPYGHRAQPLRLGRGAPLPPDLVLVVAGQVGNDSDEIGLDTAPPPVLPEDRVVVLDELQVDMPPEVLRLLGCEVGLPAPVGDELLNEGKVLKEHLLKGRAARRLGRGHG